MMNNLDYASHYVGTVLVKNSLAAVNRLTESYPLEFETLPNKPHFEVIASDDGYVTFVWNDDNGTRCDGIEFKFVIFHSTSL